MSIDKLEALNVRILSWLAERDDVKENSIISWYGEESGNLNILWTTNDWIDAYLRYNKNGECVLHYEDRYRRTNISKKFKDVDLTGLAFFAIIKTWALNIERTLLSWQDRIQ